MTGTYISSGTICAEFRSDTNCAVYFFPDGDHTCKRGSKQQFATFFRYHSCSCKCDSEACCDTVVKPLTKCEGIKLSVANDYCEKILTVAAKSQKIDVIVTKDNDDATKTVAKPKGSDKTPATDNDQDNNQAENASNDNHAGNTCSCGADIGSGLKLVGIRIPYKHDKNDAC